MENKVKECLDLLDYYKSKVRYFDENLNVCVPKGFLDEANKNIKTLENWLDKKVQEFKD